MKIIKEYVPTQKIIILRSNTYASNLQYFLNLLDEARKDFPQIDLKPEDIEIVHYGGRHYRRTFGIEFRNDKEVEVPEEYFRNRKTELVL